MRILYYINQFFGQIGGEDFADHPFEVRDGAFGPAMGLAAQLDAGNEIVATMVCGDNYAVANENGITLAVNALFEEHKIDLVVAGPAFNAGRYGMACGLLCKIAFAKNIPAISAMFEENPGLEIYRKYGFIFPTAANASGMKNALATMASFANTLAKGESVYDCEKYGYYKRGIRHYFFSDKQGAERGVDMMLKKVRGEAFKTELEMPHFSRVPIAPSITDLKKAKVAVITTCGPVPVGNPDKIEAHTCSKWCTYTMEEFGGIDLPQTEIAHGGYSPVNATNNGNRVIPIDAMVRLEKEGIIGEFVKNIYVTVGNSMPVDRALEFGQGIAQDLKKAEIQGAILTSA